MQQRKIIFINRYFHPDHSATSQLLSDLAFYLAGEGMRVHVIASRQRYDDPNAMLLKSEIVEGVHVSRVWSSRFGRKRLSGRALDYLTFYLSAMWRLIWLARSGDTVIAKTDPPLISIVAMLAARLRGARLVNWLQDVFPEIAEKLAVPGVSGTVANVLRDLRNRTLKKASVNVVVGHSMQQRVATVAGLRADQVTVIENWADGELIYPVKPENNTFRNEWGLDGKFVVGYSGNMGRVHDFETVLSAAQKLLNTRRIAFLFIGNGAQRKNIEDRAHEQALQNVILKPYQPIELLAQSLSVPDVHLVTLQAGMEGLVLPSKFYGIVAAGRPVIFVGDSHGEIARIIEEAQCGVAVQRGDWIALVSQLKRLESDPKLCSELGQNARRLFDMKYQKPLAMQAWKELLSKIT